MAHNLENARSMVYAGETPWHGLGVGMGDIDNATLDTVLELLPEAGSTISYAPTMASVNGALVQIPGAYAVIRDYDSKVLPGVVGNQAIKAGMSPRRALASFDKVFGQGRACVHTAGFLRGGSLFWVAGKLGAPIDVRGSNGQRDSVEKYFLLVTGFCNNYVTNLLLSPIRPVCNNTVTAAVESADDSKVRVKHTQSHEARLTLAEDNFSNIVASYENFARKVQIYATAPIADSEALAIFRQAFGVSPEASEVSTRTQGNIELVQSLYAGGRGNAPWQGTAWGVFNALTEYADHYSIVRGVRDSEGTVSDTSEDGASKVLDSVLFGAASAFKAKAMGILDAAIGLGA